MLNIVHRRVLGERVNALIKKSSPDLNDMSGVCEALSDVLSDLIGAPARIVVKVDAKALQASIEKLEAAEKAATQ